MPAAPAARAALEQVHRRHPRLEDCEVVAAGPRPFTEAALQLLPGRGLPRAQLFLEALEV
jgi:hypothetical protein